MEEKNENIPVEKAKPRRPGRPPKRRPENIPSDVAGIGDRPANADDIMEMVYCNPTIFRKLLTLFKSYEVSEIEMSFEPTVVKIKTKDHFGKSTIYCTLNCKLLNFYYCKEVIKICVKREYLEKILSNLDKNQYKVMFMLKENYRSSLYIVVKDCQYDKDKTYEVEVLYRGGEIVNDVFDDDTNYPIKFTLDSKHFKNEINQVRKMSQVLSIQKTGNDALYFTFDEARKLNYSGRYNDSSKIKLESKIAPDDVFSVSIVIEYIKPFSNSCIGDDIVIAADKKEKMSFTTFLDKKNEGDYVAIVKIFTEIKDYRRI